MKTQNKTVSIKETEYEKIALLWSVVKFLSDPQMGTQGGVVKEFISTYGLNTEECIYVAEKEGIDHSLYIN